MDAADWASIMTGTGFDLFGGAEDLPTATATPISTDPFTTGVPVGGGMPGGGLGGGMAVPGMGGLPCHTPPVPDCYDKCKAEDDLLYEKCKAANRKHEEQMKLWGCKMTKCSTPRIAKSCRRPKKPCRPKKCCPKKKKACRC